MYLPCPRALSRTANAAEIARSHWLPPCRGVGDGYVQVRRSCSSGRGVRAWILALPCGKRSTSLDGQVLATGRKLRFFHRRSARASRATVSELSRCARSVDRDSHALCFIFLSQCASALSPASGGECAGLVQDGKEFRSQSRSVSRGDEERLDSKGIRRH